MVELTREDCKAILQDCGFHRKKAIELSGRIKDKIEEKIKEKEVKSKVVIESKDISEPKNTYIKK
uniref:Uncharacterized protein n=1 Tax=viral metagenome TaxID=1070528 RepID=A0A6M3IDZ0_9ZZZZ